MLHKRKTVSSLNGLTPFTNMCFLMTGKFLVQEKKRCPLVQSEVILVFIGPVHSGSCSLFHVLGPEVIGGIIPLWLFAAFRACCQRESYLSSKAAKSVQEAPVPGVLSQRLIITWLMLAVGWVFKAHFSYFFFFKVFLL